MARTGDVTVFFYHETAEKELEYRIDATVNRGSPARIGSYDTTEPETVPHVEGFEIFLDGKEVDEYDFYKATGLNFEDTESYIFDNMGDY